MLRRSFTLLPFALARVPDAGAASEDGRAIMDRVYHTTLSRPMRYEGAVAVISAGGARLEKRWTVERTGSPGRGRIVLRFLSPPEVKGVALLIVSEPSRSADQWLYTPAIARARRVAPQSRGSRFYSTHLTFEDLEEGDTSSAEYDIDGSGQQDGEDCWRISARPKRRSAYDSRLFWISKAKTVILRADLSVRGNTVKRVLARGYRQQQGVWTPSEVEVADLQRGGRTVVTLQNVRYDLPLPDSRFTVEALASEAP